MEQVAKIIDFIGLYFPIIGVVITGNLAHFQNGKRKWIVLLSGHFITIIVSCLFLLYWDFKVEKMFLVMSFLLLVTVCLIYYPIAAVVAILAYRKRNTTPPQP